MRIIYGTFIVHSGTDYDYVKSFVEPYLMGQVDEEGKKAKKEYQKYFPWHI